MKTKRHQVILRLLCIGTASLCVLSFGGCSASQNAPKDSPGTTANSDISTEEIIAEYTKQGYEEVSADILYNHYTDYDGHKIITAIKVTNTAYHTLYSDINEKEFLSSLSFSFDSAKDMHDAKEGDYVIIAGTGAGKGIIGNYRDFKDCHVIAGGQYAQIEYDNLLRVSINAEKQKQAESEQEAESSKQAEAEEKESYLDSCEPLDFSTLERNPDKYKGQRFKFTGEVIQVVESDSLFNDATTLRVNVTKSEDFDLWKDTIICTVTIPKGADRILEDDIITAYGDCNGLCTYKSIFGEKISLPKIDIKYYDINS